MLPELAYNQKIFIEITHLQQGRLGWEVGSCMWSPVYNRGNVRSWKIMGDISQGDIVIHLVKINAQYNWYGISIASSNLIETTNQPPNAGKWANMAPYQRINLTNFNRLTEPKLITDFFNLYNHDLRRIKNQEKNLFYVINEGEQQPRVAQRYAAKCPEQLYNLFNDYSNRIGFNPILGENENIPTLNEPQNPDYNTPGRVPTIVSRIIRDTTLSRAIKRENRWNCQICNCSILLPGDNYYAEGHHLQPLGGEHLGPDSRENIIVLCPTHHAEFDYGCIAINPENNLIEHINHENQFHNQPIAYIRNDLGQQYLNYHYTQRYNQI